MKKHRTLRLGLLEALAASAALVFAAGALAAPMVVGDWQGALDTGRGSLRVVIHVSQDKDGKLTGTMDGPDQGATGIAITVITYQEPDLHFAIERFGCSYDGKFNPDRSKITGEWKQGGASLPLTFKRVSGEPSH